MKGKNMKWEFIIIQLLLEEAVTKTQNDNWRNPQ